MAGKDAVIARDYHTYIVDNKTLNISSRKGTAMDEDILNKQTLENIEEVIASTHKAALSLQPHLLAKLGPDLKERDKES